MLWANATRARFSAWYSGGRADSSIQLIGCDIPTRDRIEVENLARDRYSEHSFELLIAPRPSFAHCGRLARRNAKS